MAVTEEASSRSEAVYLDLRQKLLRGEFTPNYRLKLSELCAERGVSVSVVREALTRLAEQGLIQSQPNKGFYIPDYTVEEINDLAFLRSHLEALAIRLAIERGDARWEASVVAAHHELRLTPRVRSSVDPVGNQRWSRAHAAFHAACVAACGSPRLVAAQHRLYDEAEVLRQMSEISGGISRDAEGEHAAMVEAITSRDADRAAELIRRHVEITASLSVQAALARTDRENQLLNAGVVERPVAFWAAGLVSGGFVFRRRV